MKAICVVASENVVIDGDVAFNKSESSGFDYIMQSSHGIKFTKNHSIFAVKYSSDFPLNVKFLWFWHMIILRKSHVYLTGVLR